MNQRLYPLKTIIPALKNILVGCLSPFLCHALPIISPPRAKKLRFLTTATLTCLFSLLLACLVIAPAQSQFIDLPQGVKPPPSIGISQEGNLDIGKVQLDGQDLFSVAAPTTINLANTAAISPIERRVRTINFHLAKIVKDGFDPDTLSINSATLNNQTVLVASDKNWGPRYLCTVTPFDVELDEPGTIDEIAQKWAQQIQQALLQAREHRQLTYQKQQIPFVLAILAVMVAGSIGIVKLQNWRDSFRQVLEQRRRELQAAESNSSEATLPDVDDLSDIPLTSLPFPTQSRFGRYLPHLTVDQHLTISLILRPVLFAAPIVLWLCGTAVIFGRFPQTRALGGWLLRIPLAYISIPISMRLLKLILDSFIRLYIKRIAGSIKERRGEHGRVHCRALTIYSILREFNGYLVVILGFLLLFYVLNALYLALIILAAIAFLSQNVLQDFARTYFILAEDQYALGDWIEIGDINGKVEKVSLQNSQIGARCGDLFTIAHSGISQVKNFTHRYSGIDLYIEVAYSTDLDRAISVIEQVSKEMQQDSHWGQYILESKMKGIETFGDNSITIGLILMTKIGEQWDVAREYRRRLKPAFDQAGITIPFPQRSIWFENTLMTSKAMRSQ